MSDLRSAPSSSRSRGRRPLRARLAMLVTAVAVACSGLAGVSAAPAGAATNTVTNASFEWSISDETNAASFNGQCNFWSAGPSDGTAATYTATNGNATVLKLDASDTYVPISDYASRCKDKTGATVNFLNGAAAKRLGQKVRFTGGTGTVDPATGAAAIQWTGTFSVNFYGTAVPFWISNPVLTVDASGAGTVVAAMGGFASDQANPDVKIPLPDASSVVIARLSGVGGANTSGFTTTPDYSGVEYDVDPGSGQSAQNRTTAGWGAWPESFVDFQMATGLGSYWYSSGSSIDVRKPPTALTVSYGTLTPVRSTTATPSADLNPAVANTLTVTGAGFTGFASSPPPGEAGVYAGLVKASDWQPGQVPDPADFVGTTFVPKATIAAGAFSATVTVPAGAVTDPDATYGVATFCAHGCALTNRSFDTFTPVDFVGLDPARAVVGSDFVVRAGAPTGATAPVHWAVTAGTLPPGVLLDPATGLVGGTPTTEGRFVATVTATDSRPPKPRKLATRLRVDVAPANLRITTGSLPGIDLRVPYAQQLGADGGVAPYRYKVVGGTRPQGITVSGAGVVKGTSRTEGSSTFTVQVKDAFGYTATQSYTVVVAPAAVTITIAPATLPGATVGQPYHEVLTASGGTSAPHRFAKVSGQLPPRVTLAGSTGVLSGTPNRTGSYTFAVTATDRYGYVSAPVTYTVTVA